MHETMWCVGVFHRSLLHITQNFHGSRLHTTQVSFLHMTYATRQLPRMLLLIFASAAVAKRYEFLKRLCICICMDIYIYVYIYIYINRRDYSPLVSR